MHVGRMYYRSMCTIILEDKARQNPCILVCPVFLSVYDYQLTDLVLQARPYFFPSPDRFQYVVLGAIRAGDESRV